MDIALALLADAAACGRLQGAQFSVQEVEVITATVDLDEVVRYRGGHRWEPHCGFACVQMGPFAQPQQVLCM